MPIPIIPNTRDCCMGDVSRSTLLTTILLTRELLHPNSEPEEDPSHLQYYIPLFQMRFCFLCCRSVLLLTTNIKCNLSVELTPNRYWTLNGFWYTTSQYTKGDFHRPIPKNGIPVSYFIFISVHFYGAVI